MDEGVAFRYEVLDVPDSVKRLGESYNTYLVFLDSVPSARMRLHCPAGAAGGRLVLSL